MEDAPAHSPEQNDSSATPSADGSGAQAAGQQAQQPQETSGASAQDAKPVQPQEAAYESHAPQAPSPSAKPAVEENVEKNPEEKPPQEEKSSEKSSSDSKEGSTPKKSRGGMFLALLGLFMFLFVLFLVFLVVMLLQNGGNNPILGALGVEPALLKQLLTTLISLVFGFLSLISFIVFLVGLFRRFTSTKVEVQKKKQSLILALVSGAFLAFCIFVWLMLFFYISRLEIGRQGSEVILTDPPDTINLTAPIPITFSASEIEALYFREGIVSYAWDLDGDGAFDDGNARDIQEEYVDLGANNGSYNVAVKVVLNDGKEVVTNRLVTISNVLPKIQVTYSPQVLEVPLEVEFDASKTVDPDGNIISYDWDFDGDGEIDAQGPRASFEFTQAAQQEVALRVTDNSGATAEETVLLDFRKGRTKEAVIIARPGLRGEKPFRVSFDASNSFAGERIISYEWSFGDDVAPLSGRTVQYVFEEDGEYDVTLTIESADGETYETTETIVVERITRAPEAVIQVKDRKIIGGKISGEAPLQLEFDAGDSSDNDGRIVEYRWDFDGDGVTDGVGEKVAHTFVLEDTYEVTLTAIDDDELTGTAEIEVEVKVPEVQVEVDVSTFSGPVPLEVTFDASASRVATGSIISYTWNFGDTSSEVIGSARQTHVFDQVGEYNVEVEILTDDGKRGTKEMLIVAREVELLADFNFNPPEGEAGKKVFFDASVSQGQIGRYYWEFGDGSISRVVKPDHTYDKPGTYTVRLEIADNKNRISRKEVEIEVK